MLVRRVKRHQQVLGSLVQAASSAFITSVHAPRSKVQHIASKAQLHPADLARGQEKTAWRLSK